MSALTQQQYNYLLQGIDPKRVRDLRGMAHLEAWDVRRTLTRVFGIGGWDQELLSTTLAHQMGVEKPSRGQGGGGTYTAWTVVYIVTLRLIIKDRLGNTICHFDEGAAGDSVNQPSVGDAHDMAVKTAISQALKRAAVNLGDQFGLSLYNGGSHDPVIHATMNPPATDPNPTATGTPPAMPVDEVKPEQAAVEEPSSAEELRDRACDPNITVDELRVLYQQSKALGFANTLVVDGTGDSVVLGELIRAKGAELRKRAAKEAVAA